MLFLTRRKARKCTSGAQSERKDKSAWLSKTFLKMTALLYPKAKGASLPLLLFHYITTTSNCSWL
ncbi:hypothetical protein DB278_00565 [Pasteurella multocida]|nr:hypothetical protein DB278_00565 [Pasteurella multocida]